jgi:tRNA 2-thiouridine synthesizing protein B
MSTLHTINKSSFTHSTLLSCLQICGEEDGILLLEDGVFGAMNSSPCIEKLAEFMQKGAKVYALIGDVQARGLDKKLHPSIHVTDYNGFVELSVEHRCVQSWY